MHNDHHAAGLRVSVYNEADRGSADLLFEQSPVRIGRNQLNELVLNHGYVSQWHAVIEFDAERMSVTRISGTNGVSVDDGALEARERFPLSGSEVIGIRPFQLHVQLVQLPRGFRQASAVRQVPPDTPPPLSRHASAADAERHLEETALAEWDALSRRLAGQPLKEAANLALLAGRLEEVLGVFMRCFVALQSAQRQFREATRIDERPENTIERALTESDLTTRLFSLVDLNAPRHLEDAYKNVMMHQVALLSGLMAGVHGLLDRISPEAIKQQARKGGRSPSAKTLWATYERLHAQFCDEESETFETIFGPRFARAYSDLVGTKREDNS